jgi:hypothetical protein
LLFGWLVEAKSMTKLSTSKERNTFQRDNYIKRQTEKNLMDDPETDKMLDWYKTFDQLKKEKEQNPEWQKNNLEYDLRTTDWILKKVRESNTYAQHLYAAMCNNDFTKNDVWPILQEESWGCSWRYAGGIIADMRQHGDYIDWYCTGISTHDNEVNEGVVTDEIREDLLTLGWIVKEYDGS